MLQHLLTWVCWRLSDPHSNAYTEETQLEVTTKTPRYGWFTQATCSVAIYICYCVFWKLILRTVANIKVVIRE